MKHRVWAIQVAIVAAIATAGCATVRGTIGSLAPDYSELPEATVREVAMEVERAVAEGNREAAIVDRGGIVLSTPEMQQAIRTRAARGELVNEFRTMGWGIEKEDGLLTIERTREYNKGRTRREKNRDAGLIVSENTDRWALYEGIRKESGLPPRSLSAIQAIFAEARIELMAAGQKYRDPAGTVVVKSGQ